MAGVGIGRWRRGALLVAACVAGGGAAAAIAAVPGSDGTISACYRVATSSGTVAPVATGPNVRIIDPAAGQTCTGADPAGGSFAERTLNFNATGPQGPAGPRGAAGTPGASGTPGATGGSGPAAPGTTSATGRTLTLAGGEVITVGGGPTLTVITPPVRPGAGRVATLTLGSGPDALTSDVLNTSFTATAGGPGAGGGANRRVQVHDIAIVKRIDKASPKLFSACATGKLFPTATLVFRKTNGKIYLVFRFKLVQVKTISFGQSGGSTPEESITLDYASQQIASS